MSDFNWFSCDRVSPPKGVEVMTKIDDHKGCRNEQSLKYVDGLWFIPDMSMYVYYKPTHWAYLNR